MKLNIKNNNHNKNNHEGYYFESMPRLSVVSSRTAKNELTRQDVNKSESSASTFPARILRQKR